MFEEFKLVSQLWDITKILTERHANFSQNLSFHIIRKDFTFSATSSKKDKEVIKMNEVINRPGVAGAVLHTPSYLIY